MDTSLQSRLEGLRENRTSGAVDLALEALDIAEDWSASGRAVEELAAALETMHPAIAVVRNVAREIRSGSGDFAGRMARLRDSLRNGNRIIASKVAELIPARPVVITLSNSSTVRDALVAIGARGVYVMESHPGGEGAAMADALRSALGGKPGHEFVELIPDDAIGRFVPLCDCALVGIDAFDGTGAIWHKLGTLRLAQLCHEIGRPFYAVGHSLKRSGVELAPAPPVDAQTGARLFDRTPGELITGILTESR